MNIIGISAFGENPAACLVQDGVLKAFCQEERLTRLKVSAGHFPSHSLAWCLRDQKLRLGDIDRIAVSWDCHKYPWKMLRHLVSVKLSLAVRGADEPARRRAGPSDGLGGLKYLLKHTPAAFEGNIRDHLREAGHQGPIPKVAFVPHHLSHAYQTFYQSPFDEAGVLIVDGSGEERTVSAYRAGRDGWRSLFHHDVPQSLGWYFGGFTAYLGFHANRDEGKLMGLAALGERRRGENPWLRRLDRVIRVDREGFEIDPTFFKFGGNEHHGRFSDRLRDFIVAHDRRLEPVAVGEQVERGGQLQHRYLLPEYVDLAYAVQDRLEAAMLALVRRVHRESGLPSICLAGGVALNCKANGRLLSESGVRAIFVHPASSDDGAAIGAAFVCASEADRLLPNPLHHAQVGPAYSNDAITTALRGCNVAFESPDDIAEATAEIVARGGLVGWFQGGMEMGARALGGRSIIACPREADTRTRVNRRVKFREEWRPYCPSLTAESSHVYLEDPVDAPFMILARRATPALCQHAAATVHQDRSTRPQTVSRERLPLWHHLLSAVGQETGHPVVLNTSFNVRGEPIVCSPHDALRCFFGSGLDALAIGDVLVRKTSVMEGR